MISRKAFEIIVIQGIWKKIDVAFIHVVNWNECDITHGISFVYYERSAGMLCKMAGIASKMVQYIITPAIILPLCRCKH